MFHDHHFWGRKGGFFQPREMGGMGSTFPQAMGMPPSPNNYHAFVPIGCVGGVDAVYVDDVSGTAHSTVVDGADVKKSANPPPPTSGHPQ